jgi:hypothetical protein
VGFVGSVDIRREESAFLRTVFILIKIFPMPFFSLGTEGPPCAGELILTELCCCDAVD